MHLNLRPKIMAGFTLVLLLLGSLIYVGEWYAGRHLRDTVGNASALLAEERARKLAAVFSLTQEAVAINGRHQMMQKFVEASNARFAAMADPKDYVQRVDREWKDAYPEERLWIMGEVTENDLAGDLRKEFVEFTYERYGYRKYAEMIVSNIYGAVVAATGITSDYFQGDEEWWLRAMEEGEAVIGPEFDESSGVHAVSFVQRLENDSGDPIGVLKGAVDFKGIIRENLILGRRFQSTEFKVLTPEGRMVYATSLFNYDADISGEEFFLGARSGESGFFLGSEGGREKLFSYARSQGTGGLRGLDWIVVVSHDLREIMAQERKFGRGIRLAAAACILLGFVLSLYIANTIYRPVKELHAGAEAIGAGRLDYRVIVRGKDEIGRLATTFNIMAGRLARAEAELRTERESLETKVAERTEMLREANEDLQREANVRKRVEEDLMSTNEQLTSFMEASTDSYYIFDMSLKLVDANRAGQDILGKPKSELLGMSLAEFFPGTERERRLEAYREVIRNSAPVFFEDVIFSKAGVPRHLNLSAFRVGSGLGLIASDLTRLKEYEEELRLTIVELKRSNKDLEQFAYVASHDLQEPLRIVTSYIRLLEEHFGDSLDDKATQYFGFVVESARRMRRLIKDLLSYSRVDTNAWSLEAVDSGEVVRRSVENLGVAIEESGADITWDSLPPVLADEVQAVQVFQNLISNAIKFRREEALRIHIEGKVDGGDVVFCVGDNGIGIAEEFHDRIFDIFQRLNDSTDYEGTGIGLSLVKRIVERHGGHVWLDSKVGTGTKFYFTLPYAGEDKEGA